MTGISVGIDPYFTRTGDELAMPDGGAMTSGASQIGGADSGRRDIPGGLRIRD